MGEVGDWPAPGTRIHRALAQAGVASRRAAEALVAEGRVSVNGATAVIGQPVGPGSHDSPVHGFDRVDRSVSGRR